jgi:hypothetical protein
VNNSQKWGSAIYHCSAEYITQEEDIEGTENRGASARQAAFWYAHLFSNQDAREHPLELFGTFHYLGVADEIMAM